MARAGQTASVTDAIPGEGAHIRRVWRTRTEPGQSVAVTRQTAGKLADLLGTLAGSTGLEPAASGVTGRRSNQLNYNPSVDGGRYRIRTCDSRRVKPVLYH